MYLFLHGTQLNFETLCHRMAENKKGLLTTEETEKTELSVVIKYNVEGAGLGPRKSYTAVGQERQGRGLSATFYVLLQTLLKMKTCKNVFTEIKVIFKTSLVSGTLTYKRSSQSISNSNHQNTKEKIVKVCIHIAKIFFSI